MNHKLVEARFLDVQAEGDYSGDWVAESNYLFNAVPHKDDPTKGMFQIWAKLNLEFTGDGSMEYKCELLYLLSEINSRPDLETLVTIGRKCVRDLERLFDATNAVSRGRGKATIWIPYDEEVIRQMVSESLLKNFH